MWENLADPIITGREELGYAKLYAELPTMFNIVNAFQALEVREPLGAAVVKSVGAKDLSDQRILR